MTDDAPPTVQAKNEDGVIARPVGLPVALWRDVLEVSKTSGLDYRDVITELVDLGIQAQDEGILRPRLLSPDHALWKRVDSVKQSSEDDHQALLRLVDLGIQVRSAQLGRKPPPPPEPEGIKTLVNLFDEEENRDGERLGVFYLQQVPGVGDSFCVRPDPRVLVVLQRAWSFSPERQLAFLRVREVTDA